MDLTTKIRERLCFDGGEWTFEAIQRAFPGARIAPALDWLISIGLIVSPSPGTFQAVDRWGRLVGEPWKRPKPPEHDQKKTPGQDKGALPPGRMPGHRLDEGSRRVASMRRARRDKRMPGVLEDLRNGVPWKQAMVNAGWKAGTTIQWFPEWRKRIEAARNEAATRLPS